ncbi:MAG TPA: outer-membrane lipoprotein carrier protein LolA [Blastocatellia bacterium]|nr:outer-membrane lipoprotein carrier protein LolA [Blastocatellia bacterium]
MKRSKMFMIPAVLLLAAAVFVPGVRANGNLDQILANMQKAAQGLTSLRADIAQEKKNTQLGGPTEKFNGSVVFKRAGRGNEKVRVNYTNGQQVSVIGSQITLYQPSINQAIITSRQKAASKNPEFAFIVTPYTSVPELRSKYNVAYHGDEQVGSSSTAKLELTPKAPSTVKRMLVWVDKSSWLPVQFQVFDQTGWTLFTFNNLQPNASAPDGDFKIDFAKGTKIIRQ